MKNNKGQTGTMSFIILSFIIVVVLVPTFIVFHQRSINNYANYMNTIQESIYVSGVESIGDIKIVGLITQEKKIEIVVLNSGLIEKKIEYLLVTNIKDSRTFFKKTVNLELKPNTHFELTMDLNDFCESEDCSEVVILGLSSDGEIIKTRIYTAKEMQFMRGNENEPAYLTGIRLLPIQNVKGTTLLENLQSGGIIYLSNQIELPLQVLVENNTLRGVKKDAKVAAEPQSVAYVLAQSFTNVNVSVSDLPIGNLFLGYHPTYDDSYNMLLTYDLTEGKLVININNRTISICDKYLKYGYRIKIIGFRTWLPNNTILTINRGSFIENVMIPPEDPMSYMYISDKYSDGKVSLSGRADAVYVYCLIPTRNPSSYDPYVLFLRTTKSIPGASILFTTEDVFYGDSKNVNDLRVNNSDVIDYSVYPLILKFRSNTFLITNKEHNGVLINVKYRYHDNEKDYSNGVSESMIDQNILTIGVMDNDGNIIGQRTITLRELAITKLTHPPRSFPQTISLFVPLPQLGHVGEKEFIIFVEMMDPYSYKKEKGNIIDDLDLTIFIESIVVIPIS